MLEDLTLKLSQASYGDESKVDAVCTEIFRTVYFPKSKNLQLGNSVIQPDQVIDFLDRHLHTLGTLRFYETALVEEPLSWVEVMKFIAGKIMLKNLLLRLPGRTSRMCGIPVSMPKLADEGTDP